MKLKKKNPNDLVFFLGLGGTAKGVGQVVGLGVLTLQNMRNVADIGTPAKESDLIPGTASVYFATEASVSALITELTKMRKDMRKALKPIRHLAKDVEIVIDASKYNTTGRPDKRRKASGEGKK
jgi:hypothetical protein